MTTPEFLYFDLGNVLVTFDHEIACQQVADVARVDKSLVRQAIFEGDMQARYERGHITTEEFFDEFCRRTESSADMPELLHAASDIFEIHPPVLTIAAQLKTMGHRMGILSNTCEAHWEFLVHGMLEPYREMFDVILLSFEVKASKPDREIYRCAATQAGVEPGSIFFVDDRQDNVLGAKAAGFDAELFRDATELIQQLRARGIRIDSVEPGR